MKEQIIEILKNILGIESINEFTTQEDIEVWDSMHQLSIIFELENIFGIIFEPEDIMNMKSVQLIIETVEHKRK